MKKSCKIKKFFIKKKIFFDEIIAKKKIFNDKNKIFNAKKKILTLKIKFFATKNKF